ncbi:MAG: zinc ABC transporter substrate-binding protein [Chloroflexi bacterium]|jgi:ABC-type Zn uptake system ZnuABC Zn-binding protein ZnuA|nr:zinc ABC transporter substrate-binding protein [Chloroflexota bacterium]MBL17020.1 zinc ABC transporter substrate-binding protein [Chloroflexota bacterium]MDP6498082.1 metal ABC transporter substrate-binding protein [Dehalococcoidia bacterium]MQG55259.1 zinc ABC transporter substrate-binding protein [SAR202 cluster bacterium]|tara:strand:- start:104 stop:1132 length:1029 start_codon:yes stop_codon:yes gene_type:complete
MTRFFRSPITWVLLVAALTIGACGGDGSSTSGTSGEPDTRLKVVTTVSPITSIVENIAGSRILLEGVVPEGVNSHTFEPTPSMAKLMAEADLIIINGLFLEEPTLALAESNKRDRAVILSLGDQTVTPDEWQFDFTFPESAGQPNPHLWPDPNLGLRYAELVQGQLAAMDPDNATYYADNLERFRSRINQMDQAIRTAVATVPEPNRKLLTYHDSWAYFARQYGMEVIGAVQPSNFSQPSAREVAQLIDQVKNLGLPAVFGSEVFSSDVLEAIASEANAQFVDDLADDDLPGKPGDPEHSYLGLMQRNLEAMIPALGGDAAALAGLDIENVFDGVSGAVYPQ